MPADRAYSQGGAQARVSRPGHNKASFGASGSGGFQQWRLGQAVWAGAWCDFHSVNVCRMNGVCCSQGLGTQVQVTGQEVLGEGRAQPWGWAGTQRVPGREGSARPEEEFDLYSEALSWGVTGSKCL